MRSRERDFISRGSSHTTHQAAPPQLQGPCHLPHHCFPAGCGTDDLIYAASVSGNPILTAPTTRPFHPRPSSNPLNLEANNVQGAASHPQSQSWPTKHPPLSWTSKHVNAPPFPQAARPHFVVRGRPTKLRGKLFRASLLGVYQSLTLSCSGTGFSKLGTALRHPFAQPSCFRLTGPLRP